MPSGRSLARPLLASPLVVFLLVIPSVFVGLTFSTVLSVVHPPTQPSGYPIEHSALFGNSEGSLPSGLGVGPGGPLRTTPTATPLHPAPTWPGWDPASGRPSPNMRHDVATTVQLATPQCVTSYPPWAWLAYDPLDDSFWVAAPSSCVAVIQSSVGVGGNVTASFPVGSDPFGVAIDTSTGNVYVTNTGSNNVTVINGSSGANVANIPVGASPYGLAYDPSTGDVYVANGGSDTLSVISTSTEQVVDSIGVGSSPIGVAVDPVTGQVFVANNGSANVSIVATSNDTVVANPDVGQNPYGVALDNVSDQLYITNRGSATISVIDAWNDSVAVTIGTGLGTSPEGIAYNPVNGLVWVGADFYTVLVNTTTQTVLGYLATDPSGVAVNPVSGLVCVTNTANATLRCIAYPNPIFPGYSLEFVETGLPASANWSVTLYWPGYYRSTEWNGTYGFGGVWFFVFAGTPTNYTYVIPPADGYYPTVPTDSLSVTSALTINVTFVSASETYPVTFVETGLPPGSPWNVTLGGIVNGSTTTVCGFREPNGTYVFSVAPVPGFAPTPTHGSVLVGGASVEVPVGFAATPPAPGNLSVTFAETGLPTGTRWEVGVNGQLLASGNSTLVFSLAPGTYAYQVYPVAQFLPSSPSTGFFSLSGSNLTIPVVFVPVYTLRFQESGLPAGSSWSVTVDTLAESSTGSEIRVDLPAGPHTFAVGAIRGFTPSPGYGSVELTGNTNVSITFNATTPSTTSYSVTFLQIGLPFLIGWCVVVNSTELCSDGPSASIQLPNSSIYGFAVRPVPGYTAQPSNGSFSVQGRAVNLTIAFIATTALSSTGGLSPSLLYVGVGVGVIVGAIAGVGAGYLITRRRRSP